MQRFQKVLAPTDLSEHSWPGLEYALSVAEPGNSELIVLHVADSFESWKYFSEDLVTFGNDPSPWTAERALREAHLNLARFLERHAVEAYGPLAIKSQVVLGRVDREIVEAARREQVDLIVVTPRPRRLLGRLLAGSITGSILRAAPCPVLSVSPSKPPTVRRGISIPALSLPAQRAEAR